MFGFHINGFSQVVAKVAESEKIEYFELEKRIREGKVVVLANKLRQNIITKPIGVGLGMKVKINANIGTSDECSKLDEELEKMRIAIDYGADTIMDLSTGGNLVAIRERILAESSVAVGSVPIYDAAVEAVENQKKSLMKLTAKEMIEAVTKHITDGVDYITVHSGITRENLRALEKSNRKEGIVSRGGSIIAKWIKFNEKENPFYEYFDDILAVAKEYNVTLSLGDGFRPGSVCDATDSGQIGELVVLAELVERCKEAGVQAMVEGPGHVPLNQVVQNVEIMKSLTKGAPFYILGPLVTDLSVGYDHIAGAIGGAVAAMHGADFLCYLTPSEHLALPDKDDVREGVIAAKIAAHAADLARGNKESWKKDAEMSDAKRSFNWEKVFELSFNKERAKAVRDRRPPVENVENCTMCGKFCAMKEEPELIEKLKKEIAS